jgi:hypothetical protein
VRDVHVSVALLNEFMRCAHTAAGRRGKGGGVSPSAVATPVGGRISLAFARSHLTQTHAHTHTHKAQSTMRTQTKHTHTGVAHACPCPAPLRYATSNTRRGIETCGILAGSLSPRDAVFTINTLVVPKQRGTTDSVEVCQGQGRAGRERWRWRRGLAARPAPRPPGYLGCACLATAVR